jgi:flavodoxin
MLKYLVVYASETGNTKMIANEIYDAIRDRSKEMINVRQWNGTHEAENYFIGFWANRGSCSLEIIDLLSSLHHKNIALFGTCGMGNSDRYYQQIARTASAWIAPDNQYLGSYFCQGKMPMQIRNKYEQCRGKCDDAQIDEMIRNFDEALLHPDKQDLLRANVFTDQMLRKISS